MYIIYVQIIYMPCKNYLSKQVYAKYWIGKLGNVIN